MIVNCKTAAELISESLDGPLSPTKQIKVKIHLYLCRYFGGSDCQNYQKQISLLRRLAALSSEEFKLLQEVEELRLSHEQKELLKKTLSKTSAELKKGQA